MTIGCPARVRTFLIGMLAAVLWSAPAAAAPRDDTLVVAFSTALTTVDRLYSIQREGLILSRLTDDGLFFVNPDTLEFEPLAAESYRWLDDTHLNVTLRDGVRFHDGSVLTADDVVYTFRWMLNEDTDTSRGAVIRGWLDSVEKSGPLSVRFNLKMPYPMALRDMAISIPLRKQGTYEDGTGRGQSRPLNGIGPYRVTAFSAGRRIELERFEDYYAGSPKGRPAIGKMVFRVIPDEGTQQAELLSGGIDLMMNVPPDVADNVSALPGVARLEGNDIRIGYLTLDAGGYSDPDSPMTHLKVRQAINHAIDREAITRYLMRGSARAISYACHPRQFGCQADGPRYPHDPEKAKRLLAEAGYPNGFSFKLWAYREKIIAEAIVNDLEAVGLDVDLRFVKLNVFSKVRNDHGMEAFFASYGGGGTPDASASTGVHFTAGSSRNYSGDASLARTVLAAERTIDKAERRRLYRRALNRIAEQAYWVPLFSYSQNFLLNPALSLPVADDGVPRLWQAAWRQ
ncbi:substrate-binding protein, ABC-type oligopeptide transporter [Alcanivorax sp. 521-1]|uniref:Substrate-binding protein, ABC-type oligopeptide transporter n=1 Tax=Alloalcanivorax profundimaris TaxID=2735259 RepID=A0ABS0AW52_9GAMM|nr:ABC transporter substrate-binding protein [Alloalcanivorax profundimaris]MBF5057802.1 substrate-binding protein, ABC-type oligopeptide transporter [Alloalcanivorax profundimaris]